MALFEQAGSFEQELSVALAIQDLRAMLTPEVMEPVMQLMNTPLGFVTDRDPKRKNKDGSYPQAYSVDVVRDCLIESRLRGFHTVGNEFNIISGKCYGAKAGLYRKIIQYPGVTNFKEIYGVPHQLNGGAIVKCSATWEKDGVKQSCECEIPVKTDSYSGADQILGKAARKLYARVVNQLSGKAVPEGEVDESIPVQSETKKVDTASMFGGSGLDEAEEAKAGLAPDPTPTKSATAATTSTPSEKSTTTGGSSSTTPADGEPTPQQQFGDFMADNGVSFFDCRGWLKRAGWMTDIDRVDSYNEVPSEVIEKIRKDTKGLGRCVKLYGKAQA
jgi:hypothetical protein